MFFGQGVSRLIRVRRNAFGTGDVYERPIAGTVRLLRDGMNGFEFLSGIKEALVSARNVIIYLNAEYVAFGSLAHDRLRIISLQTVGADSHHVYPIHAGRLGRTRDQPRGGQDEDTERQSDIRIEPCLWHLLPHAPVESASPEW